jgi:hypothetical protein
MKDSVLTLATAAVGAATGARDGLVWRCHTRLDKLTVPVGFTPASVADLDRLSGEEQRDTLLSAGVTPEVDEREGNLLMYGGASCLWQCLIGNGTATAGQSLTYFNNSLSAIGVGDSSTAAAATQTNVQAASNKLRVAMDATYPQHTDATTSGAASIAFRSTFSTSQANFAWQEWAVFNSATDATGRMLQRKVESLGTKTSSSTWTLTVTLTLA